MKKLSKTTKNNLITYGMVILAYIIVQILVATGHVSSLVQGLLVPFCTYVIVAIALNLTVGILGELSLGHAGFMCIGAYLGVFIQSKLTAVMPALPALILSMLIGGCIAALFGFVVGLPALRLKGDYLAIVTLAFGEIVRNIFKNLPWFGGALGLPSHTYGNNLFIITFVSVLIMLFFSQNLIRSKHGRAITAIRDNEIAAKAMGINVTYYKLFVFVISAFFAGVAGVIYGNYTTPILYSFFSYNYSIEILVMVVLGGMGNIGGSIAAATLITYVNFVLTTKLSGDLAALKYLVYALILMVVVIFGNAPALRPIKEKLSIKGWLSRLREKKGKKDPEKEASRIQDDGSSWDRIPTKIRMDEVISTDIINPEGGIQEESDKPETR